MTYTVSSGTLNPTQHQQQQRALRSSHIALCLTTFLVEPAVRWTMSGGNGLRRNEPVQQRRKSTGVQFGSSQPSCKADTAVTTTERVAVRRATVDV